MGEVMDIATLKVNLHKVMAQRNIFLFFSVLLSVAVILLSCLLFVKKERIVVIPTVGPALWIEESRVSDTYLEKMGSYLSDQLLTRTPSDVERKNKILLEHVHPSFYQEAKKQLSQEKDRIIAANQTLLFRASRSYIDPTQQAYVLEGELLIFVGKIGDSPSVAQADRKRFTLEFQCEGGKLLLKSLKRENLS